MNSAVSNDIASSRTLPNKPSKKVRNKLIKYVKQKTVSHNSLEAGSDIYSEEHCNERYPKKVSGFEMKSFKIFWEQYNTTDVEVMPEVYMQLAEDATYQIWNAVNAVKTYARHSGGRITCELVNEVLKDIDCSPVLGVPKNNWNKVEYDENFFFNTDAYVDLRKKYQEEKPGEEIQHTASIKVIWSCSLQNSKELINLAADLSTAVFLGDDKAYKFALTLAELSPYISCLFKLLLRKCADMLIHEQKRLIVERCIRFICALTFNPGSHGSECREELFHLANALVDLLCSSNEENEIGKEGNDKDHVSGDTFVKSTEGRDNFITTTTNSSHLDLALMAVGCLSSHFGYFQKECTLILLKRLEDCLDAYKTLERLDQHSLSKIMKGFVALGNNAINSAMAKLKQVCIPSYDSTINGNENCSLYQYPLIVEWLCSHCGVILQPHTLRTRGAVEIATARRKFVRPIIFKILPKITLRSLKRTKPSTTTKRIDIFDDHYSKTRKKIEFRVAGCRTIPIKMKENEIERQVTLVHAKEISKKIIIVKRKLLKPLSNRKTGVALLNFCFTQI